jgi:hypothetical protein
LRFVSGKGLFCSGKHDTFDALFDFSKLGDLDLSQAQMVPGASDLECENYFAARRSSSNWLKLHARVLGSGFPNANDWRA